jgi:hypothetical protein
MKAILILIGLSLLPGGGARIEIDKDETLQIVAMNQVEMDAFVAAQNAQMKYQASIATSKAVIEKLKIAHGAQGCELNRSTMRWENCKSPMENKVSKP